MGVFGNFSVNKAKVTGGGVYLEPGDYVLKVEATKGIQTRGKGPMFVADFVVVESNNDKFLPGARVNHTILMEKDYGPGNAKEILAALSGLDAASSIDAAAVNDTNWDEVLETCIVKPVFNDKLVKARAVSKEKKDKSGSYTRTFFTPHPDTRAALHGAKKAK